MISINQENKIYDSSSSLDLKIETSHPPIFVESFDKLSIDDTAAPAEKDKDDSKKKKEATSPPKIPFLQKILRDLEHAQRDYGNCHPKTAETWNALGLSRVHMQGDATGARICHEHALAIYRDLGDMPQETATTLSDVGFCYERLELHEEALRKYEEALELFVADKSLGENHPQVLSTRRAISRMATRM